MKYKNISIHVEKFYSTKETGITLDVKGKYEIRKKFLTWAKGVKIFQIYSKDVYAKNHFKNCLIYGNISTQEIEMIMHIWTRFFQT